MTEEKRKVAIDADFFNKLTENNPDGELFVQIMNDLNVAPVMHRYVFDYELNGNQTARKLFDSGFISVYDYSDFLNDSNRLSYESNFRRAYIYFNEEEFQGDIYSAHRAECSLGEIRTSLMSWYMNIDLFMSDDGGAKQFVLNRLNSRKHKIDVLNIFDTFVELFKLEERKTKWADIKGVSKFVFQKAMYKYDQINRIWHPEK